MYVPFLDNGLYIYCQITVNLTVLANKLSLLYTSTLYITVFSVTNYTILKQFLLSVHIRDANNVSHSIHGLRIKSCDMSSQPPQQSAIRKTLNDAVANAQQQQQQALDGGRTNVHSYGDYDLHLNGQY
jgi:hypothetical protein